MKSFFRTLGTWVGIIVSVPIFLIVCVGYLFFVPIDIIRYHRMPYYKDLKNKYQFFITSRDIVKIYNRIVREQLPIKYFKNNDFEYFLKDEQVLLCGYGYYRFKKLNGEWFFCLDGECNMEMLMKEILENEMALLKPEHRCLPAKFLFFFNDNTDVETIEQAKECPYFYQID